ncbi:NUDIX domain-containing protein [bacterium]|nr:NUDIX domain-containing protein [bacterium]
MTRFDGQLPASLTDLETLPGIGRYTAGAIGSMAFGLDAPALDGNLRRVLARVFNLDMPIRSLEGQKALDELLVQHLPTSKAGDFNQAMMDLGATLCLPRSPDCEPCPIMNLCQARQLGVQEERPVTAERRAVPHYTVTAAVIQRGDQVLIAQRKPDGLLGGMWEFPGGKQEPGESLQDCLKREILEELSATVIVETELGVFHHAYTHFKVTLHAFYCTLASGEPRPVEVSDIRWVRQDELATFPMGKIDRQISRHLSEVRKI